MLFRALTAPIRLSPPERKQVRQFAEQLAREVSAPRGFTCLLTNDRELHELNRQFLGHDYPTDVLSFPSLDRSIDLGELAISVERASVQAAEFGHSAIEEIRVLMLHGLLHLTGLDHESDSGEMAAIESKWRNQFELPSSLLERTATEHSLPTAAAESKEARP